MPATGPRFNSSWRLSPVEAWTRGGGDSLAPCDRPSPRSRIVRWHTGHLPAGAREALVAPVRGPGKTYQQVPDPFLLQPYREALTLVRRDDGVAHPMDQQGRRTGLAS